MDRFESKGIVKPNIITGLPLKTLKEYGVKLAKIPEGFEVNRKVQRVLQKRLKQFLMEKILIGHASL